MLTKNDKLLLKVYINAKYARSIIDERATADYCTFFGGYLVT